MENLSKKRRDEMIAFLELLKKQHSDDDSLIAINRIEKELTSKDRIFWSKKKPFCVGR